MQWSTPALRNGLPTVYLLSLPAALLLFTAASTALITVPLKLFFSISWRATIVLPPGEHISSFN